MERIALTLALSALLTTACAAGDDVHPPAPPAGQLVVADEEDLVVVGADGTGRRVLVRAPGPQFDGDWSPDGARIAYRNSRHGINRDDEIYAVAADGSAEVNLTRHPANDWSPAWSPDGELIAFASDREGELRIFAMAPDGSRVRRITEIWGEYPAWSPDGRRIAFASFAGGSGPTGDPDYDLFIVDLDGGGLRRLTRGPANDMYPAWSPDGKRIAFQSTRATPAGFEPPARDRERTADFDVFVVDAEGGEPENLTRDPGRLQKFPDWSPDGRWLAVDEEGVVAFVPADGSGAVVRVPGAGLRGGFPAWAPGRD